MSGPLEPGSNPGWGAPADNESGGEGWSMVQLSPTSLRYPKSAGSKEVITTHDNDLF